MLPNTLQYSQSLPRVLSPECQQGQHGEALALEDTIFCAPAPGELPQSFLCLPQELTRASGPTYTSVLEKKPSLALNPSSESDGHPPTPHPSVSHSASLHPCFLFVWNSDFQDLPLPSSFPVPPHLHPISFSFLFSKTVQINLQLTILLWQPPQRWDYSCVLPDPVCIRGANLPSLPHIPDRSTPRVTGPRPAMTGSIIKKEPNMGIMALERLSRKMAASLRPDWARVRTCINLN